LGLIIFRKRTRWAQKQLAVGSIFALLLTFCLLQLAACSSSSQSNQTSSTQTSGTPKGTQTIVVTAADANGSPSHTFNVRLTIH
jgi:hypothetical protein